VAASGGGAAEAALPAEAAASCAWPAAVVAASAALVAEFAEAAAESAAAPAAGAASVVAGAGSVLADSCFAQAVSISAAVRALRASLVFIDQYPEGSKSGGAQTRLILSGDAQIAYRGAEFYRVAEGFEICVC
jgi:hypothetical protein